MTSRTHLGALCAAALLSLVVPAIAAPGDLDLSFGTGGKVVTPVGSSSDYALSVTVQSDGKILVAGDSDSHPTGPNFALVRYTTTGALDTSFNGTGKVITDVGGSEDHAYSVAVQSDGKILVAGDSWNGGNSHDFAVVRYTASGALDTSFNGTGKVITTISSSYDRGYGMAVQSDGKILVAGVSNFAVAGIFFEPHFALVRYTDTGALDTSFGTGGKVTTLVGNNSAGVSVAVQSDGKILVAGGSSADFALVRYTSTGALDSSFNGTGKVITDVGGSVDHAYSVRVQSDGKILVAGHSIKLDSYFLALVRYTSTGALDPSFNGTGKVSTDVESTTQFGEHMALQSDGKILLAGRSGTNPLLDFALARYTSMGALDTSFNGTGEVITSVGSGRDEGWSVTVQSDGKILVAGFSETNNSPDFALVRYEGGSPGDGDSDGLLDTWELTYWPTIPEHNALNDFDGDGVPELLEEAFGLNPTLPDADGLPQPVNEGGYLTMTITKQPGVTYEVQSAGTLLDAQPDSFSPATTTILLDDATTLKVRDNFLIGTPPARYLRVKVTSAP